MKVDKLTTALLGDEFRRDGLIKVVDDLAKRHDEYEEQNDKRVELIEKKSYWLAGASGGIGWAFGILTSLLWK